MFNFDKANILEFLDKATDAIKAVAPIASSFGIPFVEKVAGWADTAVEIAQNALKRAEEADVVISSQDKDEINEKIKALHEENNALADYIRNS